MGVAVGVAGAVAAPESGQQLGRPWGPSGGQVQALVEAGNSAPPPHIQITGTLSSMVLVSSGLPSLPPPAHASSSSPSSMSSSLPASEGV